MLAELMVSLLLGILAGTFTGLIPGIHINLVSTFIISSSAALTFNLIPIFIFKLIPIYIVVFIVSMSIAHVFMDFISSIFLGAPEDGTELSVLPGHEMLKQGLGLQAFQLTSLGCITGIFAFLISIIPLYFIVPAVNEKIIRFIPLILVITSLILILSEKKKISALFVFTLSGILGLIVLNLGVKEPLTPMLTGLFGASSLILSLGSKTRIEKQNKEEKIKLKKTRLIVSSSLATTLTIFLPAISSGQITILGNQIAKADRKEFLFMLGIINSLAMCFSFLALFLISKTRTGSAVAVENLIGAPNMKVFILILIIISLSGIISFIVSRGLAKKFLGLLEKLNYSSLSLAILCIILIVTFLVSGFLGLVVLAISTLTGIYCLFLKTSRTTMMGCLLIPTILLYLL